MCDQLFSLLSSTLPLIPRLYVQYYLLLFLPPFLSPRVSLALVSFVAERFFKLTFLGFFSSSSSYRKRLFGAPVRETKDNKTAHNKVKFDSRNAAKKKTSKLVYNKLDVVTATGRRWSCRLFEREKVVPRAALRKDLCIFLLSIQPIFLFFARPSSLCLLLAETGQ